MKKIALIIAVSFYYQLVYSQCLSSVNPVGGNSNLLALQSKTIRTIAFYRFNYGNQYFHENKHSDFDLINCAFYNYIGTILGYGITSKLTLETEAGYFVNKTQRYNVEPLQKLRGYGFSNVIFSARYGIFGNHHRRLYYSASAGVKIPCSANYQVVNGVELTEDVQPSLGSYGVLFQSFLVKENSLRGLRFFLTNRLETNLPNRKDFKLGTSFFTSFYISKHLMFQWLKGDWTTIFQLRNEIRNRNKREDDPVEASGSVIFFLSPQINFSIKETWNISVMIDFPVYQYLNGVQLGTKYGITFGFARDFIL